MIKQHNLFGGIDEMELNRETNEFEITMRCNNCKNKFEQYEFNNKFCKELDCQVKKAMVLLDKKKAMDKKEWNKEKKVRKDALKTLKDYIADLQVVFNRYIRIRDKDEPCISCKRTKAKWDAGHYYNANNHWIVRFNEDNVHKQCSRPCNKDLSGNLTEYRFRLINKIGIERVEYLDSVRNQTSNFTIDQIKGLIVLYKLKIKQLEK